MPPEIKGPDYWFESFDSTPKTAPQKLAIPALLQGPQVKIIHPIQTAKQTDPQGYYVDCTSHAKEKSTKYQLSPFYLGPCKLYVQFEARRLENAWQYSKVYPEHVGADGIPTQEYFAWAKEGWESNAVDRYPMGKGAKSEFHWWDGRKLTRVEARKEIYVPLYAEKVTKPTNRAFDDLQTRWQMMKVKKKGTLYLMDFDAYDYSGMTLTQVLNNPTKSMGHGFVLAMLLMNDPALKDCLLRRSTLDWLKASS